MAAPFTQDMVGMLLELACSARLASGSCTSQSGLNLFEVKIRMQARLLLATATTSTVDRQPVLS
jgi:hypothetical protein